MNRKPKNGVFLSRHNDALSQCAEELAIANRQLQQGLARHKIKEAAFQKSEKRQSRRLKEALQLQERMRQLTHRALTVQEDERKALSGELKNGIAQTLLGINIRLLALKQEARGSARGFKNEIAKMQRLVADSAKSVRRFAHELDLGPQA